MKDNFLEKNPFYKPFFAKFDRTLSNHLDHLQRRITTALLKVENRVINCENKMRQCMKVIMAKTKEDVDFAELLVNKELRYVAIALDMHQFIYQ